MARRRRTRRTRRDSHGERQGAPVAVVDRLLHLQSPDERPWKFLLPVLVLAFAVRAAIALCGDFVLHPDEVMQYLEPAHRLVFGGAVAIRADGIVAFGCVLFEDGEEGSSRGCCRCVSVGGGPV